MNRKTLRPKHQEDIRRKIQGSQLIVRLQNHSLGKLKKPMDDSQVRAALGLLKKVLADQQATQISGHEGGPLVPVINLVVTKEAIKE